MRVRQLQRGFVAATTAGVLAAASSTGAEFVRDEIRINVRTGPGLEFRIVGVLTSGDKVRVLNRGEEWVQVRNGSKKEGWIPEGYLTRDPPPSRAVPILEAKLVKAQERIQELDAKIAAQSEDVLELDTLRTRNAELEGENMELSLSSRWRMLLAGGSIVLVGMLIGAVLPRGGTARQRRIKL